MKVLRCMWGTCHFKPRTLLDLVHEVQPRLILYRKRAWQGGLAGAELQTSACGKVVSNQRIKGICTTTVEPDMTETDASIGSERSVSLIRQAQFLDYSISADVPVITRRGH